MAIPNINLSEIDFDHNNIIFVDDLTLETVKIKYGWLLNAKVKDAIVGQDDNGLVWYFGDWLCGEWYDGTWYSGNFYSGTWRNGQWYAYDMDKFQVLSNNATILSTDIEKSRFINGFWENGTFNSGIFGVDNNEDWEDYELSTERRPEQNGQYPIFRKESGEDAGNVTYNVKSVATWLNGTFVSGKIYDSIWMNGIVRNCTAKNIQWVNGKWFNGIFDGHTWYNGLWYNGSFIKGVWKNGTFNHLNKDIVSRFGNTTTTLTGETICTWENGTWMNGEFFAGIIKDSNGNILPSKYNIITIWENGTWVNGHWYGGHFKFGTWKNGIWENGIFGNIEYTDWYEPNYVYQTDNYSGNWSNITTSDSVEYKTDILTGITDVNLIKYDDYNQLHDSSYEYIYAANDDNVTGWIFDNIGGIAAFSPQNFIKSNVNHSFSSGDEVYIISNIYTGYSIVNGTGLVGSWYYITVEDIKSSSFDGGQVFSKEDWDNFGTTNTIKFCDIELDVDDLSLNSVNGYQISYDTKLYNNGVSVDEIGDVYDDMVSIHINKFTDGYFYEIENYGESFFNVNDDTLGDDPYGGTVSLPNVLEGKYSDLPINTLSNRTKILGNAGDVWTLQNLNKYGDKIEYSLDNEYTATDEYRDNLLLIANKDFTNIDSVFYDNGNFTLSFRFKYNLYNKKRILLSNVKIRAILTTDELPIWQNGIWNRGTWLTGEFNNGKFLSGMWVSGEFNDGQMGGN